MKNSTGYKHNFFEYSKVKTVSTVKNNLSLLIYQLKEKLIESWTNQTWFGHQHCDLTSDLLQTGKTQAPINPNRSMHFFMNKKPSSI